MGGNAFKTFELSRIRREDISATVQHVVDTVALDDFTYEYAMSSLMGSTGKKPDSGDIDFAMNTYESKLVGETVRPLFDKHEFMEHLYNVIPGTAKNSKGGTFNPRINTQTLKMGNLMTAWPIAGDEANGLIQVDFVFGNFELLQFTHYSPSSEESEFKGVFVSQSIGILAKMLHKYYDSYDPDNGERTGRVGLHLSLEEGLYCGWESRRRKGMGCSKTTADEFETRFPDAPRISRIGHITNPDAIVQLILGDGVTHDQVNTFEKIVDYVRIKLPDRYGEFWERFMQSAGGSGIAKQNGYDPVDIACHPVWKASEVQIIASDLVFVL